MDQNIGNFLADLNGIRNNIELSEGEMLSEIDGCINSHFDKIKNAPEDHGMMEITSNADLVPGNYYHCFEKGSGQHSIEQCFDDGGSTPKYIGRRFWAQDDHSQALARWRIIGPISIPKAW